MRTIKFTLLLTLLVTICFITIPAVSVAWDRGCMPYCDWYYCGLAGIGTCPILPDGHQDDACIQSAIDECIKECCRIHDVPGDF